MGNRTEGEKQNSLKMFQFLFIKIKTDYFFK